jgi:uncharacterized alkaline shock family protein YloU
MQTVPEGKITVAPEVLLEIIQQAALYTEGVVRMASVPPRVDRIFRRVISAEGIEVEVNENSMTVDLYLVVRAVDLRTLSHQVQREVIRAMDRLVGIAVTAVNIHVEDVEYPENGSA